jgi:hypothetical protein
MKYLLLLLLLISTMTLCAQALPRVILVKLLTADGSTISPSDIFIRAYFQERPEEIHTSITRPKHFNCTLLDSIHKGMYVMLNPAAFRSNWEVGETLIADITQESTGATVHFTFEIPPGTNVVWVEKPITLSHNVPNLASDANPADKSIGISKNMTSVGWSFNLAKGYIKPIAFRLAISTDSLFSNASVLYIKSTKAIKYTQNLPDKILPLKSSTTYYWKIIPTTSTDEKISPTSLRTILINGKPLKPLSNADSDKVPVWSFTTGN